jgi:hypothetical protein
MSKGVVFNNQITYTPGVYVESVFQTLVGRPAGAGFLAVVGEFNCLEGKQAYFAQSLSQLKAIAPMDATLLEVANIVYSPSSDQNALGVPAGIYLISPNATTQASVAIESSITVSSRIWGPLGNLTTVEVEPDSVSLGWTVVVSNSGLSETIRVPKATGTLTIDYTTPAPDDADLRVLSVVAATNVFTSTLAHGLAIDDEVELIAGAGGVLPAATPSLDEGTTYFVKSVPTTTTFTLSDTDSGGANIVIDVTDTGTAPFYLKKVADRLTLNGLTLVEGVTNGTGIDVQFTVSLTSDFVGASNAHNSWVPGAPVSGTLTVTPSDAATLTTGPNLNVRVVGTNSLGVATTVTQVWSIAEVAAAAAKTIDTSLVSGTPVNWASVTSMQVWSDSGDIDDLDGSMIVTGKCFPTLNEANGYKYVSSVIRAVNSYALSGFAASTLSGKTGSIEVADLDAITVAEELPITFDATISTMVATVNAQSSIVEMEADALTPLTLTEATDYTLVGGSTAVGDAADWVDCLDELKLYNIDGVVPLSTDAAVHTSLLAHCVYMQGNGANDRQGFFGAGSLESFSALQARVVALGTGFADVLTPFCDDSYITTYTGSAKWFGPEYTALQGAAIAVGNLRSSLTRKKVRSLATRRNTALMTKASEEDLIRIGYTILTTPPGGVPQVLRWVTAWLEDESDILTDGAAVRSRMIAYKALRAGLAPLIGTLGTTATRALIETRVSEIMDQLVRNGEITRWLSDTLTVSQSGNTWLVGLEFQPTTTVLFIGIKATLSVPTT